MLKASHSYTFGDQVWHASDTRPFTVLGLRLHEVEIAGTQGTTWVPAVEVEPWQSAFLGVARQLHEATAGATPNPYRYVAAGAPTLLAGFEQWVDGNQPWYVRQVLGRRPETLRQMLSHERPLELLDFIKLCHVLDLSIDEATARYWANAPAGKIGEQQRVEDNIAQLHTLAAARKLVEPK